jgi:site-specific DNA-methyltransferase (adenine-specific)
MTIDFRAGDCLVAMASQPAESVDLICTDPPYNVSVKNSKITRGTSGKYVGPDIALDFGEWDRAGLDWTAYIEEFVRLLKPNGVLAMFYDKLQLGQIGLYLQGKHGFQVRHIGTYVKSNPAPQARKVKWQNGCENFLVATKNTGSGHHFNYGLGQSPDYFMRSVNYKHEHPTQKPLDLIEWIVKYWSFEDDTVADPFAGSGTTAVACIKTGRNFIGFEIEPEYVAIAERRIAEAQAQATLPPGLHSPTQG